jgi:hypothetical protein
MKLLLGLTLLSFITTSCDQPQRTRVPTSSNYVSGQDTDSEFPSSYNMGDGEQGDGIGTGDGNTDTGSGTNSQGEAGFQNCDISTQYNGGSLGSFGLCQHDSDERRFKVKFSQSNTAGTCFVPVHVQSGGNSFKLGIAECVHNQADNNYYMTLNKEMTPPNFSYPRAEALNGVMVISASSVNAYMGCMNSKEDFLVATQGCCYQKVPYNGRYYCLQPNAQCENTANNYANNVCGQFVQNHTNNYRQVSF